uniref:IS4 family transposase n=1 Tax=Strongyloides stercoralis TaxID=6248 RepID=A0A0K0DS63_STRER
RNEFHVFTALLTFFIIYYIEANSQTLRDLLFFDSLKKLFWKVTKTTNKRKKRRKISNTRKKKNQD